MPRKKRTYVNKIEIKLGTYEYQKSEVPFNFTTDLSMTNKIRFVKTVVGFVVDEDEQMFNAIVRDLFFNFAVLDAFTDVDVDDLIDSFGTEDYIDELEDFFKETQIIEIIKKNMVEGLWDELNDAVDDAIAFKTGIHKDGITYSVVQLIRNLNKRLEGFDTDGMMDFVEKITNMSGEFTAEKLMDAYANSELHKQVVSDEKDSDKVEKKTKKAINSKKKTEEKHDDVSVVDINSIKTKTESDSKK